MFRRDWDVPLTVGSDKPDPPWSGFLILFCNCTVGELSPSSKWGRSISLLWPCTELRARGSNLSSDRMLKEIAIIRVHSTERAPLRLRWGGSAATASAAGGSIVPSNYFVVLLVPLIDPKSGWFRSLPPSSPATYRLHLQMRLTYHYYKSQEVVNGEFLTIKCTENLRGRTVS